MACQCLDPNEYEDERSGETICQNCGEILVSTKYDAGPTFSNNQMTGSIMGINSRIAAAAGTGAEIVPGREATLERAFEHINQVANQLSLSEQVIQGAQRIYALALTKKATKRRRNLVSCACLYAACRREGRPFLLVDFADVTRESVPKLSRAFIAISKELALNLPRPDPSMFVEKALRGIPLVADKQSDVAKTAYRVLQFFRNNWLQEGRRPGSLFGAAVLIACRFHGFRINAVDLEPLTRCKAKTIERRVAEFERSPAAHIPVTEFMSIDIDCIPALVHPPREYDKSRLGKRGKRKVKALEERVSGVLTTELDEVIISAAEEAGETKLEEVDSSSVSDVERRRTPPAIEGDEDSAIRVDIVDEDEDDDVFGDFGGRDMSDEIVADGGMDTDEGEERLQYEDANRSLFKMMILTGVERRAKELLWDELTKDKMAELHRRRQDRGVLDDQYRQQRLQQRKQDTSASFHEKMGRGQKEILDDLLTME